MLQCPPSRQHRPFLHSSAAGERGIFGFCHFALHDKVQACFLLETSAPVDQETRLETGRGTSGVHGYYTLLVALAHPAVYKKKKLAVVNVLGFRINSSLNSDAS